MTDALASQRWWGETPIPRGEARRWRIGPLTLWVARLEGEWRIGKTSAIETADEPIERARPVPLSDMAQAHDVVRYGVDDRDEELTLGPRLADRAVVSRPDRPFVIPPGEASTLYVGTPLWIALSSRETALGDAPLARPSDSWFGPPNDDGELCYASRTFCRLLLEEVPIRPHRATTAVTIRNHASLPLPLERLKLPVTSLGLYVAADGRLWTESVSLEWVEGTAMAAFRIQPGPPLAAPGAERLAVARAAHAAPSVVVRAFSTLFG